MISYQLQPIEAQAAFTNDLNQIYAMHQVVRRLAIEAGFTNTALGNIELAVVEACANIIKHAYRQVPTGTAPIAIHVMCDFGALAITVTDWGAPFDAPTGRIPAPDPDRMVAEGRRGGMGLFFIQQMMDEVAWDLRPGECNRVRLVKRLA